MGKPPEGGKKMKIAIGTPPEAGGRVKIAIGRVSEGGKRAKMTIGTPPEGGKGMKMAVGRVLEGSGGVKIAIGNILEPSGTVPTIIFIHLETVSGLPTAIGYKQNNIVNLKRIIMATQIRSFGMSKMSLGSCSDFHNKVVEFINQASAAELHIEGKLTSYQAAIQRLAAIVNRQMAFVSTPEMKTTDRTRDNASGTISGVTNAYTTSPVETKRIAAQLLSAYLSPYKGIRNHEYSKQTAEVNGMLAALATEEAAEAIEILGLKEEVDALRTANAAFEAAFLKKTAEMSGRLQGSDVSSAALVAEANTLYQDIVQVVNAYAIVQPSEAILTFIDNINGLVGVYSRIAGGSSSGGSTTDDAPIIDGGGDEDDRPVIE